MASRLAAIFGFKPIPVTLLVVVAYLALFISIAVVHVDVPAAPKSATPLAGINLTEAWTDLQELTNGYHPYNSKRNDEVRNWLLLRLQQIFAKNAATVGLGVNSKDGDLEGYTATDAALSSVVLFNDLSSNLTFSHKSNDPSKPGVAVYFEGTNIIVYIRGTEDLPGKWWENDTALAENRKSGVLVNAHYDSVSTGYGATDDGVGVITNLQLASYFTTKGNTPKKGLIILFNNGEEDFLNGASVFLTHPVARFAHTFLNLEGAGAGGRATLFRASDSEVTSFYGAADHPYGTVVSADGFKRRLISSETDYVIFNGVLGMRGLDVAFWQPRARYHTDEDDARHTSLNSVWHMLSSSISTVKALTSDLSSTFESGETQKTEGKLDAGRGSEGVWFDLYGASLIVAKLHTLFALSVTLLVLGPVITLGLLFVLYKQRKLYFFTSKANFEGDGNYIGGWKGFFRFPLALILSGATLIGLAFLANHVNPLIAYSSQYVVWSLMLSACFILLWFCLNGANAIRPTALQRGYAWLWLCFLSWIILIMGTVAANSAQIGSGYLIFIYYLDMFLASVITILELLALPRTDEAPVDEEPQPTVGVHQRGDEEDEEPDNPNHEHHEEDDEPTESTSLLRPSKWGRVFAQYSTGNTNGESSNDADTSAAPSPESHSEQSWAKHLPSWTWILQFLIAVPFLVIIFGQVGLLLTTALGQTGADGGATRIVYLATAIFSLMIILPISPFLHKVSWQVPVILFLVFVVTLLYTLLSFPFSTENRLKVYFVQEVDLDTSFNNVSIIGVAPYISQIAATIPSAVRNGYHCDKSSVRSGLTQCTWTGLPPRVVDSTPVGVPPSIGYQSWLTFNVTRDLIDVNKATFTVVGNNTRAARLMFNKPVINLDVSGSATSELFDKFPLAGATELRLWSRTWESPWEVTVAWNATGEEVGSGLDGKVVGVWSDDNALGVIPALDEIRRYVPSWIAISKATDGLVMGYRRFTI